MRCSEAINAQIQKVHLSVNSGGAAVENLIDGWPRMAPNPKKLTLIANKNFGTSPCFFKDPPDSLISFLRKSQAYTRAAQLLTSVMEVNLKVSHLRLCVKRV
jgi:hypothetical protein